MKEGEEWSPQLWLPQPHTTTADVTSAQSEVVRSMFRAIAQYPALADIVLEDFGTEWSENTSIPKGDRLPLSELFGLANGRSSGEKNFPEGVVPYISSGDQLNSIVRLVTPQSDAEVFSRGAITVTTFGLASVQPWPFVARGNGGSSVRVLVPKTNMTVKDLVWFAAQINLQRWRYFYARQAILGRLKSSHFRLENLPVSTPGSTVSLAKKLRIFRTSLEEQSIL